MAHVLPGAAIYLRKGACALIQNMRKLFPLSVMRRIPAARQGTFGSRSARLGCRAGGRTQHYDFRRFQILSGAFEASVCCDDVWSISRQRVRSCENLAMSGLSAASATDKGQGLNGAARDLGSTQVRAFDRRKLGRWLLKAAAGLCLLFILTPLIFVTWFSFYRQEIPSFPPDGYSLRWYAEIANNQQFLDGFWFSLQVGVVATAIGMVVGIPAALCISRFRFFGREFLNSLLLFPLMVPGVVLGTAFYVFEVEIEIKTNGNMPVLGSLTGLVAGHTLLVIPWVVRLIVATLANFDLRLEEAAQNLGANRWTTFRRVTLPSMLPGIVASAMFGFVASFSNLEMSLFLVGPGSTTLPITILQYLEWKIDPTIAAVSVLQILLVGVAMLITDRFVKISRVV
ncbi:ABC transporter permease [Mesorhizobium sp. M0622]|uniref:ABC transporter permease n=2 Tax=Mesorhizobium TaxID=68287 RepID=UPI0033385A54